jgi:hypothetical protein
MGQSIVDLAVGRGLIGVGVSACLMAAFKAFSLSFPAERQASLTGWIMTSGGLGALAATAPLDAALHLAGWRDIFFVLAGLTLVVAGWLFISVPEGQGASSPESTRDAVEGSENGLRQRPLLAFRATRPVPDWRLHGGAEPVVDLVADAGGRLHACACRRPHGRNERGNATRVRADRPPRHHPRKARDQAGAVARRRPQPLARHAGADRQRSGWAELPALAGLRNLLQFWHAGILAGSGRLSARPFRVARTRLST